MTNFFSKLTAQVNGTVCFKNVKNCLNTNIYSELETPGVKVKIYN
jgi:hypothetical protein